MEKSSDPSGRMGKVSLSGTGSRHLRRRGLRSREGVPAPRLAACAWKEPYTPYRGALVPTWALARRPTMRSPWSSCGDSITGSDHLRLGNTATIRWVPGHRGVEGNELADQYARAAAESRARDREGRQAAGRTILPFLRRKATERATRRWREDIREGNQGERTFWLPTPTTGPGIRPRLRGASKAVAARHCQLLRRHAMTAPFLNGRQSSRERLFKGALRGLRGSEHYGTRRGRHQVKGKQR